LHRRFQLLTSASVAIDGSKFKAVNGRDKNFTEAKMRRRLERLDESIARYLSQLETAAIRETADSLRVNLNPAARSTKLDLLVEESDNPDELGERLSEYEAMQALHLSCDGHNAWQLPGQPKAAQKPVLLLATEEGAALLIGALRGHRPRLVFLLSGCPTAAVGGEKRGGVAGDKEAAPPVRYAVAPSLAETLIDAVCRPCLAGTDRWRMGRQLPSRRGSMASSKDGRTLPMRSLRHGAACSMRPVRPRVRIGTWQRYGLDRKAATQGEKSSLSTCLRFGGGRRRRNAGSYRRLLENAGIQVMVAKNGRWPWNAWPRTSRS
jgi:hypothetical protein